MSKSDITAKGAVVAYDAPYRKNHSMNLGITVFDRGQMNDENKSPRPDYTGNRDNIVTNRPPAFTAYARAAWVQAREDAALDRLLGGAA